MRHKTHQQTKHRPKVIDPTDPRNKDPNLPQQPKHSKAVHILLRQAVHLLRALIMLLGPTVQLPKEQTQTERAPDKEHRATDPQSAGLHARARNHPPRPQAREHHLPQCKSSVI